jgi:16S rRNA (adenine1518-N6/adenine1519-N6)-dimethyltransferase
MKEKEILDVVDEFDRVIRCAPRAEIHAEGLRHRASHVLLHNGRGEVLLQKRALGKEFDPGRWDSSASGHVHSGEEYWEAALREVREELGIELGGQELTFLGRLAPSSKTANEFVGVFLARCRSRVVPNPEEVAEISYFPIPEIDDWMKARPSDFARGFLRKGVA